MYDYEYVSLEVARIIKEKGFCEECRCFYQSISDDVVENVKSQFVMK